MKKTKLYLKFLLLKKYGSLRVASEALRINYFRLSQIVNGWVVLQPLERRRMEKALGCKVLAEALVSEETSC